MTEARLTEIERTTMKPYLRKYIEYIRNTGGEPTLAWFDEDWEPVGPTVRADLLNEGVAEESDGKIRLTEAGRRALEQEG